MASRPRPAPRRRSVPGRSSLPPLAPATVTVLNNGLTLIVREDHFAPVVSVQAWCHTGSIHEGRWLGAGLSHVLEHMLFKGTARRTGARIDQEVQEAGGYMNAFTSFDRTVYWINVPNTGSTVAIDILCDIMQNASLPGEELAKELEVIRREMDMNQDDPARRASRRLFETAYTHSPYRLTIIGYPDIFSQLKPEDIRGYYLERYVPNNVFFVVVGDIHAHEVVAQIREAYAGVPARPLPPVYVPTEPHQTASRDTIEEAPIELGHVHFSWHIPDLRHPDLPALDILATLLGTGRSSRLYREVRQRKALVHSVDAWTYSPGQPGLFGISAVMDADRYAQARQALLQEVGHLQRRAVNPVELRKAVKQHTAATLATRKSMQGQAQDLGSNWLAADDLNFSERYLAAVERLTPSDIQRVACQYLTPENRTHYALLPAGSIASRAAATVLSTDHAATCRTLPNGLRLILKEDHRLPFVEFRIVFKGGVLAECPENNGLTWLLSRLLLKGTRRRTAEQIAREIESVGGQVDTYGGNNSFGLQLEVLRSDIGLGIELLADVTLTPAFPRPELEREREVQLAGIRAQRDQLLKNAGMLMRRALFGDRGYGLDALGTEESVQRLKGVVVRDWHRRFAVPANGVLAICGDIDLRSIEREVLRHFGRWRGNGVFTPSLPDEAEGSARPADVRQERNKRQAVIVLGFPGTTVHHPDRLALEIIQEACSDLGSRLFLRVRERLGLAYYVGAQNFAGLVPGYFAFYAGTTPGKVDSVEAELATEARLLATDGLSSDELRRAKAKILGQKKIARQDLGGLAMTMALDELYGLGYRHGEQEDALIEAVTVEDTRRVAARYLQPEHAVVSLLRGKEDAAEDG